MCGPAPEIQPERSASFTEAWSASVSSGSLTGITPRSWSRVHRSDARTPARGQFCPKGIWRCRGERRLRSVCRRHASMRPACSVMAGVPAAHAHSETFLFGAAGVGALFDLEQDGVLED